MSNDQPLQTHHGEIAHHEAPVLTPTEAFLEKNFRKIVLLVIVAIAALAVFGMIRYKNHQTALAAAELVTSAKTVEDCDLVVQKYPGSVAAGNSMLVKADLLWKANKKDSALGVLRDFTKNYPKHPFFLSGLMGLASKLESTGDNAEAKAIYERMTGEFGKSEFAPLAQIRLGDMLWADGKDEEAKKLFESLPSRYPGELSVSMSQNRLDLIAAGLPTKEVDGPPQPKKADEPVAPGAASAPIQITPGGVTPIKLDAGLGAKGVISPTATATVPPQASKPAPALKVTPAPLSANPAAAVKMIEPKVAPSPPVKPAETPVIKLGPPVPQTTPAPTAPAANEKAPAASTPPASPPSPAPDKAKK